MVLLAILSALALPAALSAPTDCWPPPVIAAIADPYRPPACRWCPGNRGVTYATGAGVSVDAVAAGTVTFAGTVAGTGYVVVEIPGGRRLTYGNLTAIKVSEGAAVTVGQRLGQTAGELHFGLRGEGPDDYLDPTPHLGRWRWRIRLVPTDGPAPPAAPPMLSCVASVRDAR